MPTLRTSLSLVCLLLAVVLIVPTAAADDDKGTATKPASKATAKAELDAKSPAIVMEDTEGRSFELLDCGIQQKEAEAVVLAAAQKFGAAKDAKLTTKIADLKGVKDEDGDLDTSKVKELAVAAGRYFGLTATDESAESFTTLADLAAWITAANDAPILLLTWGPRCPTSARLNDAIVELVANTKIRAYAIACNYKDTPEHYARFLDSYEFNLRIFPDRDQRVTDILGGKTTPHFFLFDTKGVLRYRGGLNNDPMGYMEDDERKDHLAVAIAAIRAGKDVEVKDTAPSG